MTRKTFSLDKTKCSYNVLYNNARRDLLHGKYMLNLNITRSLRLRKRFPKEKNVMTRVFNVKSFHASQIKYFGDKKFKILSRKTIIINECYMFAVNSP